MFTNDMGDVGICQESKRPARASQTPPIDPTQSPPPRPIPGRAHTTRAPGRLPELKSFSGSLGVAAELDLAGEAGDVDADVEAQE